ncbi:MAG: GntR family transcriptional regulator [Firmicutes bacterium]|nr:GntR family transcriptional regulator [Bacillota bacterium]
MTTITKTSIKDQVYQIIKKKIYDQEYDFGDTINITALSKELGVSNTPIREALSRLEVEGLVKTTMSTKTQVISLDEKEFAECAISFFVTAFGAYTLCYEQNTTDKLLQLMDEALAEQRKAFEEKNFTDYVDKSNAFDRTFAVATGNERVLQSYDNLTSLFYPIVRLQHSRADYNREENLRQHEEIRDAVAEGDFIKTKDLLYKHFNKHL